MVVVDVVVGGGGGGGFGFGISYSSVFVLFISRLFCFSILGSSCCVIVCVSLDKLCRQRISVLSSGYCWGL